MPGHLSSQRPQMLCGCGFQLWPGCHTTVDGMVNGGDGDSHLGVTFEVEVGRYENPMNEDEKF